MVLFLLKHEADAQFACGEDVPRRRDFYHRKSTALRSASRRNHLFVIQLLLDPIYNLKYRGKDFENAIIDSVVANHTDMVKFLLEKSTFTHIKQVQYQVLRTACRLGHTQIVHMMLDAGLDVNAAIRSGSRGLEIADRPGLPAFMSLWLSRADPNYGGYGLYAINIAASNGHQEIVSILLDHGANVNSTASSRTPLWEAAKEQQVDMMRFLLFEKGADLKAGNGCGASAFNFVVINGHEEVVRILAKAGVNVDGGSGDEKEPPILKAMIYGQDDMVELLLSLGTRWVDPFKSASAKDFVEGVYPRPRRTTEPL